VTLLSQMSDIFNSTDS